MSSTDLAELPTPDHITLLFKCHKSTVLLSILPHQPWSDIKVLLLAALTSRGVTTFPGSDILLPQDPEQLELGILRDKKDAGKGWMSLPSPGAETTDAKSAKRKGSGKSIASDNPGGVGLTDGGLVAYRLLSDATEPEDDEIALDEALERDWDVILPMFEDEAEDADF